MSAGASIELLAPAGEFASGYYAFEGGADAVYLGLPSFSARSGAGNFSHEELRRFLTLARERSKKVYVALNTIIQDAELEAFLSCAADLEFLGVDGIILQQVSLASPLVSYFPRLELHASTQAACKTADGLKFLKDLGFHRVVLPRELGLRSIEELRTSVPDIELEVFIHGALCFSFSGMCLASGLLLNRSANRGECAQLCRSSFSENAQSTFAFSCCDLQLGENVARLKDMGVASLKIEGRMKGPKYTMAVCAYYRALLNGQLSDEALVRANRAFARTPTEGFLRSSKGHRLLNLEFPGHIGIRLGDVMRMDRWRFFIKLEHDLFKRDGIQFQEATSIIPVALSVESIHDEQDRELYHAKRGNFVWVTTERLPAKTAEVRLISSRADDLKSVNPGSFAPLKHLIRVKLTLTAQAIEAAWTFRDQEHDFQMPVNWDVRRGATTIETVITQKFSESGNTQITLIPEICVASDCPEKPFLPPSLLKQLRNQLIEAVETSITQRNLAIIELALNTGVRSPNSAYSIGGLPGERSVINPGRHVDSVRPELPFVRIEHLQEPHQLADFQGRYWAPLDPYPLDVPLYNQMIEALCGELGERLVLGINSVDHFRFVREMHCKYGCKIFGDFFFYMANRFDIGLLNGFFASDDSIPVIGAYDWVERSHSAPIGALTVIADKKNIPAFFSAICFAKHSKGEDCAKCTQRSWRYELSNRGNRYCVCVQDCRTYMFLENI
jgi:putative protease